MTHVLHLVDHDLRTHRGLLLAWLGVVLAHPLVSLLPWPQGSATVVAVPLFLIVSRLMLAAVALATIVQADSPLDDRTFWRTRPIARRTMATAKVVIGGILVAVPLAIVLLVALVVRVPLSHLPSTIAQVVVTDAAAIGLALLLAARTRSLASMLIATLGTLVAARLLLFGMSMIVLLPWVRQFYANATGPRSPELAEPALLIVIVLAAWTMATMVFLGERYRLRLRLVGGVPVLAVAIVWLVPAVRLQQPPPRFERPSLSVDGRQVRAERLESGRIALMAAGTLSGLPWRNRSRQYVVDGTIESDEGSVAVSLPGYLRPGYLRPAAPRPGSPPVVFGELSESDFTRLAGRPVRFRGRIGLEVTRTQVVGTVPLVAGTYVAVGDMRVRIREVQPSAEVLSTLVPLATVDVTWTAPWTQGARVATTQWSLRHGADRQFVFDFLKTPFTGLGLLPSLAWPFGHDRSVLYVPQAVSKAIEPGSWLEIEEHRGRVHLSSLPLRIDFVVPTVATPYDAAPESR